MHRASLFDNTFNFSEILISPDYIMYSTPNGASTDGAMKSLAGTKIYVKRIVVGHPKRHPTKI